MICVCNPRAEEKRRGGSQRLTSLFVQPNMWALIVKDCFRKEKEERKKSRGEWHLGRSMQEAARRRVSPPRVQSGHFWWNVLLWSAFMRHTELNTPSWDCLSQGREGLRVGAAQRTLCSTGCLLLCSPVFASCIPVVKSLWRPWPWLIIFSTLRPRLFVAPPPVTVCVSLKKAEGSFINSIRLAQTRREHHAFFEGCIPGTLDESSQLLSCAGFLESEIHRGRRKAWFS